MCRASRRGGAGRIAQRLARRRPDHRPRYREDLCLDAAAAIEKKAGILVKELWQRNLRRPSAPLQRC